MRSLMTLGLIIAVAGPAAAQVDTTTPAQARSIDAVRINGMVRAQLDRVTAIQQEQQAVAGASIGRLRQLSAMNEPGVARVGQRLEQQIGQLLVEARRTPRFGITLEYAARETDRYGVYITAVTPGGPADKAGIMAGDVLTRIAGKSLARVAGQDDQSPAVRATEAIATLTPGKAVDVVLRRGTQVRTIRVTPADDETMATNRITLLPGGRATTSFRGSPSLMLRAQPAMPEMPSVSDFSVFDDNGMKLAFGYSSLFASFELAPMNEKLGAYFGTTEGVLVVNDEPAHQPFMIRDFTVQGDRQVQGQAVRVQGFADSGRSWRRDSTTTIPLQPGDVIVSVDGRKVTSPSQLMRIVASYDRGDEFKLQIMRQKRAETIPVKMP